MQVKSVQSPNFGMAMKIDPQAKIRLKAKPPDILPFPLLVPVL